MALHQIPALQAFIKQLEKLPFIQSRYILKLSDYFLSMPLEEMENFFKSLIILRNSLELCSNCNAWKEIQVECLWCSFKRDKRSMCIVETWIDAGALEKSGIFVGQYYILGGYLDPLNGKTPHELPFNHLISKVKENKDLEEIIIGTNQTPEGNATSLYIQRLLDIYNIKIHVTQLASGVPVGSSLEFVDRLTIGKAFTNRR